ncbi:hypothetical protein I4F81_000220 [Pyropia yezoensis]|uniref:Uncharacterized protein n=1 Tax=Pyropia yezoensis TaxID=2788 RepID=A0ACC3BIJ9_PYRYE|nr:hypothetical protein I4F81_000220 [Neopyropia yezoensis]
MPPLSFVSAAVGVARRASRVAVRQLPPVGWAAAFPTPGAAAATAAVPLRRRHRRAAARMAASAAAAAAPTPPPPGPGADVGGKRNGGWAAAPPPSDDDGGDVGDSGTGAFVVEAERTLFRRYQTVTERLVRYPSGRLVSRNRYSLFLALDPVVVASPAAADADEVITVHQGSLAAVRRMILGGEMSLPSAFVGLAALDYLRAAGYDTDA